MFSLLEMTTMNRELVSEPIPLIPSYQFRLISRMRIALMSWVKPSQMTYWYAVSATGYRHDHHKNLSVRVGVVHTRRQSIVGLQSLHYGILALSSRQRIEYMALHCSHETVTEGLSGPTIQN
ncbi:uncharacterized protein B0T23DRAFT_218296 [Neurospora hispaniola]|uniref:Uncharacterized protein n=1 Tax=Neurospora hispaniola TaxID=588809 RepID=A0AAJ0MNW3_9PEZI|nr:hypothetical protein B0T23DRAFT_218296 [Neurospora hispaniola]